jgi:tetratricopeptide (TPR) repeat protein
MPEATWPNERCYAMRLLGKSYDALGQNGIEWYQKACKEAPNTREPWVELAQSYLAKKMWQECYTNALRAIEIKDKALVYTMNPDVWGALPHDLIALAAYNLKMFDEAVSHGTIAVELEPNNERLKTNLEFYRNDRSNI